MYNFNELHYFVVVAQASSFVKAGKALGISSSALSHSMSNLETKLNLRLFNRTTRSMSLTEAGEQLYKQIAPLFQSLNQQVSALSDFLSTPSGTIRINAPHLAVESIIYPKLRQFLPRYPQIKIEIEADNNWVDIVKQGFDMGCRLGNDIANDMIAVKISAPLTMAVVASPDYLKNRPLPKQIKDLDKHQLIGKKISAQHATELAWEFNDNGNIIKYQPSSQLSSNSNLRKQVALDGLGITWIGRPTVEDDLAKGNLIELLEDFAITYEPFYIYYPSRKGHSQVFKLVLDALKF
ncbi:MULTISPECIES: LysR family transcriptional regulator [unclassified Gilliamella]|uniref:LysR family transcriptional regulator n=1 Tax=unclassified Gilliamella TaxID=2685620 RepID=UPI00226ADB3A|nr:MULTISPECIES: LysR family transcriptional regulator [unclassified Gilliamella]MCX8642402.1 LysR family transcriptional regulator [Gilliamella sp. B3835]MCX8706252.1 LysR family transcriptional regulator [Gilliamella sp. B3783]MCX8709608.1 LysR family transcriptional regulator [Gilliamella sp. B3780]MCX8712036.1 LysR family transcriptional regulator [Gilliamella sp. B3468]MCX8714337.1 LysR family transcriptional regulator [Gilliamella sp. B3781]